MRRKKVSGRVQELYTRAGEGKLPESDERVRTTWTGGDGNRGSAHPKVYGVRRHGSTRCKANGGSMKPNGSRGKMSEIRGPHGKFYLSFKVTDCLSGGGTRLYHLHPGHHSCFDGLTGVLPLSDLPSAIYSFRLNFVSPCPAFDPSDRSSPTVQDRANVT
jgi:hypothetical protein